MATMDVISSGILVPTDIMVRPITLSLTPKNSPIFIALSMANLELKTIPIIPSTTNMYGLSLAVKFND